MKIAAPASKSIVLTILVSLLLSLTVPVFGQKRGRGPQKSSVSKAAGLVEEGDKMADERKYPEAIDAYKLAIRLDANYAPAYAGLGDAYFNSGNSEQAAGLSRKQTAGGHNRKRAQRD